MKPLYFLAFLLPFFVPKANAQPGKLLRSATLRGSQAVQFIATHFNKSGRIVGVVQFSPSPIVVQGFNPSLIQDPLNLTINTPLFPAKDSIANGLGVYFRDFC